MIYGSRFGHHIANISYFKQLLKFKYDLEKQISVKNNTLWVEVISKYFVNSCVLWVFCSKFNVLSYCTWSNVIFCVISVYVNEDGQYNKRWGKGVVLPDENHLIRGDSIL